MCMYMCMYMCVCEYFGDDLLCVHVHNVGLKDRQTEDRQIGRNVCSA